jgi:hypothetical protein
MQPQHCSCAGYAPARQQSTSNFKKEPVLVKMLLYLGKQQKSVRHMQQQRSPDKAAAHLSLSKNSMSA